MKILLSRISPLGEVIHEYPSLRAAAKELECSERALSDMLKKKREFIETPFGQITKVTTHDGQTYGTPSAIPEHTTHTQENSTLGAMAIGRGWGRVEQALEQITSAVKWVVSKFHKP